MSILKFLKKLNTKQQDDNAPLSNDSLGGDMAVRPSSAPDRETYKQTITPPQPMAVQPQDVQVQPMDTSTRPRVVQYSDSMGVPPPPQSDTQKTQGLINHIQTKDYSLEKDADGNVIHRGADRDKQWSLKDKIGSTLLGILEGAKGGPIGMLSGGLNAGMDRDYLEKRDDAKDMRRLVPRLAQQQQAANYEQDRTTQNLNNDILAVKPDVMQQNANTAAERQQAQAEYQQNLIGLGKQKADDIRTYHDQIIDLKRQGASEDDPRVKILRERVEETKRHHEAAEGQQATNEEGRNTRAANTNDTRTTIARDTRNFNAGQKDAERKLRVAMQQYGKAADKDKAMALEAVRVAREEAKAQGIQ